MSDDISDISDFYNRAPEREHERLEQHQLEFDLTLRYLDHYLPPQGTAILEIGAATGRYTIELAKRGYNVTAVDLSSALIDILREQVVRAGLEQQVTALVADARDLSQITNMDYDAVLLMGPLYHLIAESDRKKVLQQAYARLRKNGILFTAFLSRFGTIADLLKDNPQWIEDQAHVESFVTGGKRPDTFPRGGFRGYFAHVSEITPLHETLGFETLAVAGVEPIIAADDQSYNKLQGRQRHLWLDLLYALSTQESIIGSSRHLLYIGKKIPQ